MSHIKTTGLLQQQGTGASRGSTVIVVVVGIILSIQFVITVAVAMYIALVISEFRITVDRVLKYIEAEQVYAEKHKTDLDRFLRAKTEAEDKGKK